jgi:chromatin remodeling complex protein RSC6
MKMSESKTKRAPRAKKSESDPKSSAVKVRKPRAPKVVEVTLEPEEPTDVLPVCVDEPELVGIEESELVGVEIDAEVEVIDKKKKIGKKVKKQQLVCQVTSSLEKLGETMKKDLESSRLDKAGEKLLKRYIKEVEHAAVISCKVQKKPKAEVRATRSGFSKPYVVTDSMAEFAGWELGAQKSRIEINNCLCAYIKSNELQSINDKRVIIPDAKLSQLLDYSEERHGALNYAVMQKFISHLLIKN